ncbi:hypothetical protein TSA6c_00315 [Azospirillum sp. TSA6c]|uniref:hypothetical protein n=1 Tax=Azospirillum sp. TSA6c TaxID=709813 RepID=UPI000D61C51B|nr:hypothetical protein [Azospirillum sp. TSA6c]PWC54405.1 hypothetical protein TSA6c_00315 [Azospirillum sp. TSA6c]
MLSRTTAKRSGIDYSGLAIPKGGRKVGRVDKSALTFGEPERIRDRAYLDSSNGRACECCGQLWNGAVVAAHVSIEQSAGMGLKASDDLTLDLCHDCHSSFDTDPRGHAVWIAENIVMKWLRHRYRAWCRGGERARKTLNARAAMPENDR